MKVYVVFYTAFGRETFKGVFDSYEGAENFITEMASPDFKCVDFGVWVEEVEGYERARYEVIPATVNQKR